MMRISGYEIVECDILESSLICTYHRVFLGDQISEDGKVEARKGTQMKCIKNFSWQMRKTEAAWRT
jgi:hypothetical protein